MDSGSITAIAATQYIKTFTCGFDLHSGIELSFDEREKSELGKPYGVVLPFNIELMEQGLISWMWRFKMVIVYLKCYMK
jgi:hypothetical protein